jgi:hypothetical protein
MTAQDELDEVLGQQIGIALTPSYSP